MRLLNVGDRIVEAFSDGSEHGGASGIIAFVHDLGRGDYAVLLYDGKRMVRGTLASAFTFETIHYVYIDVVERGCKVPPIPLWAAERFRVACDRAMDDYKHAKDSEVHEMAYQCALKAIRVDDLNDDGSADLVRKNLEGTRHTDEDLFRAHALMAVIICRQYDKSDACFRRAFFGAMLERIPAIIELVRPRTTEKPTPPPSPAPALGDAGPRQ